MSSRGSYWHHFMPKLLRFVDHDRVDACHLKGRTSGQLMVAVGKDGNENMFPIAHAVVEGETKETWIWFLTLLIEDIGSVEEHGWTFISDRQKVNIRLL